ncbi:hypothetical protein M1403_00330 [Patescibacteria group bacterium]|nr:hypothetical protein [Patescibacteria group bacterium]
MKIKKLPIILIIIILVAGIGAGIVLYKRGALRPPITNITKKKITVSADELAQAEKLEELLQKPVQTGSGSAKPSKEALEFIAKSRVQQRKILEAEAPNLKIDLNQVKQEAEKSGAFTAEGKVITDPALARIFTYDQQLVQDARQKIEGYTTFRIISFPAGKEADAQKAAETLKANPNAPIDDSEQKITVIGKDPSYTPGLVPSPTGYQINVITDQNPGLGKTFIDWYQQVLKKYEISS